MRSGWINARRKQGDYPDDTERSGKWLVWLSAKTIDRYWQKMKEAVEQDYLGNAAKVATAGSRRQKTGKPYLICVYTYDYEDKADVMRIRSALRELSIRREIIYKADEDTPRLRYSSDYTPNIVCDCMKGRTNMALILYPDGTSKEVHPANGDHFEYEELMQIVEGMLQLIPLPDGRIMTLNAEGRPDGEAGIAGLPLNEQATALAGFPSAEGPLATLRGLGVAPPSYSVGPGDLAYIPGTVLVSTKHEVSWTE